jgi:hypothetical protein
MGDIPASPQTDGWLVMLTCCGRDNGVQWCPTWDTADAFRDSYVDAGGHKRTAIIKRGSKDEQRIGNALGSIR